MIRDLLATQFPNLDAAGLADIEHALVISDHDDGHVFIREGTPGDTIFLVVSGTVEVVRLHASEPLNNLGPGDLFGLVAIVDDHPRSATCRAVGPCRIGAWPRNGVRLLFNQHAPIAHAFQLALATQLARDFRQLETQVRRLMAGSPES